MTQKANRLPASSFIRDAHILARIFAAAGVELRRDPYGVAQVVRRENRPGQGLGRAALIQAEAGRPLIR